MSKPALPGSVLESINNEIRSHVDIAKVIDRLIELQPSVEERIALAHYVDLKIKIHKLKRTIIQEEELSNFNDLSCSSRREISKISNLYSTLDKLKTLAFDRRAEYYGIKNKRCAEPTAGGSY